MTQIQTTILAFTTLVVTIALPAFSQPPDRQGNYFSNEAPIQGEAQPPLMKGSLWQVTTPRLNCRKGLGIEHAIVRQFKLAEILQADVGRGGSDEVLLNAPDRNGNPWMRVRSLSGKNYNCYVRANRRYIQPYFSK